jgi:hypothetical protein
VAGVPYQDHLRAVPATAAPLTAAQRHRAALIVCAHARDPDDARALLAALGLLR